MLLESQIVDYPRFDQEDTWFVIGELRGMVIDLVPGVTNLAFELVVIRFEVWHF